MDEVDSVTAVWEFLTRDVTVVGGLQSPMLSWIGAAGILSLCLWHGAVLTKGLVHIQRTLSRFQSSIAPLVLARQQVSKDWLVIPALAKRRTHLDESPETRRDLDDLQHWIVRYGRNRPLPEIGYHTVRLSPSSNLPGFLSRPCIANAQRATFSRSILFAPSISMSAFTDNSPHS